MKYINGDLINLAKEGYFDVIVHGCNCMCTMGAGIAKFIKIEFPQAYEADCKTEKGYKEKNGTCSFVKIVNQDKELFIVNAYTQYNWRGKKPLANYDAISSCMKWIKKEFKGKKIGLPKIGAGLAGGEWSIIENIIKEELQDEDVNVVIFNK